MKKSRVYEATNRIVVISLTVICALFFFYRPGFADSLDDLKRQIEVLQGKVQDLEQKQATQAEKTEVLSKGKGKGSFLLPGLNTELTIGGYVKLDAVHSDVKSGGDADLYFYPAAIPLDSEDSVSDHTRFGAKQSRLFVKSNTPTPWGDLKVHLEGDFYGEGGNQNVSNSSTWRLRHAYGQLGNLLAGQTWTTFMNVGALPETVDFGGPAAQLFIRQAQIRWTQPLEWGSIQVAAENPETTYIPSDTGVKTSADDDRLPDFVARVNLKTGLGSFSLAGLGREFRVESNNVSDSTYAGAVSVAGVIPTFGKDDFRFTVSYGNGLGRYMYTNFDGAELDLNDNSLDAVDQWGGFVAYRHFWMDALRSTVSYSYGEVDNDVDLVGTGVNKKFQSAHANLIWSPVPAVNLGIEYLWGYREIESGADGDLNRFQFSAQYSFF